MALLKANSCWECDTCTYENNTSHSFCEMCGTQKPFMVINNTITTNDHIINDDQKMKDAFCYMHPKQKVNGFNFFGINHTDSILTKIKTEWLWQWNDNGMLWKDLDFKASEQIDDEILSQYDKYKHSIDTNQHTDPCINILFAITKGQPFNQSQNKIYFCNVLLNESTNKIKKVVLNNIKTGAILHIKRKTELNLNAYGNGKYPNHNIFSKTA
eukprot:766426_1